MIRTLGQLKALVRSPAKGDSAKTQIIIRNYVIESAGRLIETVK